MTRKRTTTTGTARTHPPARHLAATLLLAAMALTTPAAAQAAPTSPASASAGQVVPKRTVKREFQSLSRQILGIYDRARPSERKLTLGTHRVAVIQVSLRARDLFDRTNGAYILESAMKTSPAGRLEPNTVNQLHIDEESGHVGDTAPVLYELDGQTINAAGDWSLTWSVNEYPKNKEPHAEQFETAGYTPPKQHTPPGQPPTVQRVQYLNPQAWQAIVRQVQTILDASRQHAPFGPPELIFPSPGPA